MRPFLPRSAGCYARGRRPVAALLAAALLVAGCTGGERGAPGPTTPPAPAGATTGTTATTAAESPLERAAAVASTYFRARGAYEWDEAAAVATGAAAAFVTHLSVAHLVTARTAPLPERPGVDADLRGARREGDELAVDGTVTVRWSDGGRDRFDGLRFVDVGDDLLLADYANAAGPLSSHLVDGSAVPPGRAGAVEVAVVAVVRLAPGPVVAVTLRLGNGGDVPAVVDDDGVELAPAGGGPPVVAGYRRVVPAAPGGTGYVLAELPADGVPDGGGVLRVTVADDSGRPLGTAALPVPSFAGG